MEVRVFTEALSPSTFLSAKDLGERRWRNMSNGILAYRNPTNDLSAKLDVIAPGWVPIEAEDKYTEYQLPGQRQRGQYHLSYTVTLPFGSTEDQIAMAGLAILQAETASQSN